MKKVFLFFTVYCIAANIQAQDQSSPKKMSYYIGPQTSITVGDLAKTHSLGVGIHGQALRSVGPNTSLGVRASYSYLFGKKFKTEVYEPGGSYGTSGKYKGMSDFAVGGSVRQEFDENCYGGLDLGTCFDFGEGNGDVAAYLESEFGYRLSHTPAASFLSIWLGICGDPKIQIGLRYSIKF